MAVDRDGRLSWPKWLVTYRDGLPTHPSTNPAAHGRESNSQPVDHKSDALTTRLPSIPSHYKVNYICASAVQLSWHRSRKILLSIHAETIIIDWEFEFYESKKLVLNSWIFANFKMPPKFKKKFAVMSYNMKLQNFFDLQTYKQN